MNARYRELVIILLSVAVLMTVPPLHAGIVESVVGQPDFNISYGGFLRSETAISITSEENPWNQRGVPFNGETKLRRGAFVGAPVVFEDTVTRPWPESDTTLNMQIFRGELNANFGLTDKLDFRMKLRAIGDPDVYNDQFDIADVPFDTNGPPTGTLHRSEPNFYEQRYDSGAALEPLRRPDGTTTGGEPQSRTDDAFEARQRAKLEGEEGTSPLEWAGKDYMLDLPQFYLNYNHGPLFIRAGNQQIAWGDMLFFRVLDVPNALDLRRHLLLDLGAEEFSDKRVPALGLRVSYLVPGNLLPGGFLGGWEFDGYVQRFRPTILTNPNTPYNIISSQFTIHDQFKQFDNEANYGFRLRGPVDIPFLGSLDLTLMANRRYNSIGILQFTDHDVVGGLDPNSPAGTGAGDESPAAAALQGQFPGQLADVFFEPDPSGVVSTEEYIWYAGHARVDWFDALNKGVGEFPAAEEAGVSQTPDLEEMARQIDAFHQLTGGLRGHVTRDYERENNFGLGLSFDINGPDNWLVFNQTNVDIEMKYTPDRKFTPLNLSAFDKNLIEEDEYEIALVMQEFVRYSNTFPSAFVIFQYLHRSESDLFNRHLSGFGAEVDDFDPHDASTLPKTQPDGISSFNAIAFAFQQPWPNRIWRIDFAALYDLKGGLQLQPALRWKPNTAFTVQGWVNFIDTVHGNPTENALSTLDFADEVTVRLSYQF